MKKKNRLFFYISRILVAVAILLIYLYGLRPLRRTITQQLAIPVIITHANAHTFPYKITNKSTAITFQKSADTKKLRYQPQLGLFFLISLIALVFITMRPNGTSTWSFSISC